MIVLGLVATGLPVATGPPVATGLTVATGPPVAPGLPVAMGLSGKACGRQAPGAGRFAESLWPLPTTHTPTHTHTHTHRKLLSRAAGGQA